MNLTTSELKILSDALRRELRYFQGVEGGIINSTPNHLYIEAVRKNLASFEDKLDLLERINDEIRNY